MRGRQEQALRVAVQAGACGIEELARHRWCSWCGLCPTDTQIVWGDARAARACDAALAAGGGADQDFKC